MQVSERRSQILAAATRLFVHYGPHKTTIADVAREAGIGVGTVYLEFPSKDAIVEELARTKHGSVLAAMHAAIATESTFARRLPAALDARLVALFRLAQSGTHACDLVHCGAGSAAVKEAQERYLADERELVCELVRRAARAREIAAPDPEQAAHAILACYATFTLPFVLTLGEPLAVERQRAVHRVVLFGLLRRPRAPLTEP